MNVPPRHLRHFHAVATCVWAGLVIPSVIWWKDSIAWVVLMSVWANLASHFAAWQATRVEDPEVENGETA